MVILAFSLSITVNPRNMRRASFYNISSQIVHRPCNAAHRTKPYSTKICKVIWLLYMCVYGCVWNHRISSNLLSWIERRCTNMTPKITFYVISNRYITSQQFCSHISKLHTNWWGRNMILLIVICDDEWTHQKNHFQRKSTIFLFINLLVQTN